MIWREIFFLFEREIVDERCETKWSPGHDGYLAEFFAARLLTRAAMLFATVVCKHFHQTNEDTSEPEPPAAEPRPRTNDQNVKRWIYSRERLKPSDVRGSPDEDITHCSNTHWRFCISYSLSQNGQSGFITFFFFSFFLHNWRLPADWLLYPESACAHTQTHTHTETHTQPRKANQESLTTTHWNSNTWRPNQNRERERERERESKRGKNRKGKRRILGL